jgi:hypothetical protein
MATRNRNGNGASEALSIVGGDGIPGVGRVESPEDINSLLMAGRVLPQVHAIEEGSYVRGTLLGRGPKVEYTDAAGDSRPLDTWNIEVAPGVVLACVSSYQLEHDLPALVGKRICILKAKKKSLGDRQVNKFLISDLSGESAAS